MRTRAKAPLDVVLLTAVLLLVFWGLVMVYSASAILAEQTLGNAHYFIKRQLLWAALSLGALWWFSRLDYNRLREWVAPALAVTLIGLVWALFSPPIANVRRWIRVGPVGLQPAEFAKLAAVLFLASYLDRRRSKAESPVWGLLVPIGVVGALLALIARQPDLGTPSLIFASMLLVLFVGGAKVQYVAAAVAAAVPVGIYELLKYPYRRARVLSFLRPFETSQGAGYQLSQALLAVGSGGWWGKGLGAGQLKLHYLPTPHTDFIFPVVCEELGLLGALGLLTLYVTILVRGVRAARLAPNLFGTLLACGVTFTVVLQAFFNMAMAIGLLPTKGIPLPFISFGGSSLLASCIGMGVLLNVSRQAKGAAA